MFKELLWIDALRGKDSTGVLSVIRHTPEQVRIAKQVGSPDELANDKRFDSCFQGQIGVLIGHNRWKTKGAVNRRNAHPFEFSEVAGVHNGTLHSQYMFDDGNSFDVDSEALYSHMNTHGAYETIKIARGALALAWYNKKYGSVNFYRNKERPLWFANSKDGAVIFFASEPWMLMGIAIRNEVELQPVWELHAEHMISFSVEKGTGKIGKPTITKISPPKEEPRRSTTTSTWQGNSSYKQSSSSNVVELPGKKPWTDAEEQALLGTEGKDAVFKVGLSKVSAYGSAFIELEHVTMPELSFIVYTHNTAVSRTLNTHDYVLGSVERTVNLEKYGWCFVVNPNSVEGLDATDVGERTEDVYPDHTGTMRTKIDFENKYPYCSWCQTDINADEDYIFTKNNDILCSSCCKDKDILELTA